ncbi:MAG: type IV pilus modification PilV family protein [Ilumatobacteraceae bacterium]
MNQPLPNPDERPDVAPRDDRGVSLTELLISIVLIGMVVVSMLAALFTSIKASSVVFEAAQVETVLLNAGDRIARAPQLCEYEEYVDAAALAEGWTVAETSVVVELYSPGANGPGPEDDWVTQTCPDDVSAFDVQRLTVTATNPDGDVTRTLMVVKSNVE